MGHICHNVPSSRKPHNPQFYHLLHGCLLMSAIATAFSLRETRLANHHTGSDQTKHLSSCLVLTTPKLGPRQGLPVQLTHPRYREWVVWA